MFQSKSVITGHAHILGVTMDECIFRHFLSLLVNGSLYCFLPNPFGFVSEIRQPHFVGKFRAISAKGLPVLMLQISLNFAKSFFKNVFTEHWALGIESLVMTFSTSSKM